jgi:hypothetical protein
MLLFVANSTLIIEVNVPPLDNSSGKTVHYVSLQTINHDFQAETVLVMEGLVVVMKLVEHSFRITALTESRKFEV